MYARYFSDHTSAEHIVFCYSLWRRVTETKAALTAMDEQAQTSDDKEALDFLRKRGSLHLLVAAVASAAEIYLGRALTNTFDLSFGKRISPAVASEYWAPLVDALLPFAPNQLGPVFITEVSGVRNRSHRP